MYHRDRFAKTLIILTKIKAFRLWGAAKTSDYHDFHVKEVANAGQQTTSQYSGGSKIKAKVALHIIEASTPYSPIRLPAMASSAFTYTTPMKRAVTAFEGILFMIQSFSKVRSHKALWVVFSISSFLMGCGEVKKIEDLPTSSEPSETYDSYQQDRGTSQQERGTSQQERGTSQQERGTSTRPTSSIPTTSEKNLSAPKQNQDCSQAKEAYEAQIKDMANMGIFFQENRSNATPDYSSSIRSTRIEVKMKLDTSLATSPINANKVYASYEKLVEKVKQYIKACGSELSEETRVGLNLRAEISHLPLMRNFYKKTTEKIEIAEKRLKDLGLEFDRLAAKNYQQKLTGGGLIGWNLGAVESKNVDLQSKEVRSAIQNYIEAFEAIKTDAVKVRLDASTSSGYSSETRQLSDEHGYTMGKGFESTTPTSYGTKKDDLQTKMYLVQELKTYLEQLDQSSERADIYHALLTPTKNMIIKIAKLTEETLDRQGYRVIRNEAGEPIEIDSNHLADKFRENPFGDKKLVLTAIQYSLNNLVALQVLALDLADTPTRYLTETESRMLMSDSIAHQANLLIISLAKLRADLPPQQ